MSSDFCRCILYQGLLYDAQCNLLAVAKFLVNNGAEMRSFIITFKGNL